MRSDMLKLLKDTEQTLPRLTSLYQRQSTRQVVMRFPTAEDRETGERKNFLACGRNKRGKGWMPTASFPMVDGSVDITHIKRLQTELPSCNRELENQILSTNVIYKHKSPDQNGVLKEPTGHLQINLASFHSKRNYFFRLELGSTTSPETWSSEPTAITITVLYGHKYVHKAKDCRDEIDICGKCSEPHQTKICRNICGKAPAEFTCLNCAGCPRAGSSICSSHISAAQRLTLRRVWQLALFCVRLLFEGRL